MSAFIYKYFGRGGLDFFPGFFFLRGEIEHWGGESEKLGGDITIT